MESIAITEGGEWTCFDKVCNSEEADFMANLFSNDLEMSSLSYEPNHSLVSGESNLYSLSLGSNLSVGSESVAYQGHENYCLSDPDQFFAVNDSSLPVEFYSKEINHSLNLEMRCDDLDQSENTRFEISELLPTEEDKSIESSEAGKKRCRSSEVEKGKRNTRAKRNRKTVCDDEDNSRVLNHQNSGSCISSEELSGENSNVLVGDKPTKTRASRGSATDPQSLYARKRRGRINERLRILQSLVPNGTKVDLSTMLEEAVHYVKFLQLQIKLLSSDDLWMYAPLAYNGMDAGLEAKINSLL